MSVGGQGIAVPAVIRKPASLRLDTDHKMLTINNGAIAVATALHEIWISGRWSAETS